MSVPRDRLFSLLDEIEIFSVTWISSVAGSGKTTLLASYLETRGIPSPWYRVDEADSDAASFFYYMSEAGRRLRKGRNKPLPLLSSNTGRVCSPSPATTSSPFSFVCPSPLPLFSITIRMPLKIPSFTRLSRTGSDSFPEGRQGLRRESKSAAAPPCFPQGGQPSRLPRMGPRQAHVGRGSGMMRRRGEDPSPRRRYGASMRRRKVGLPRSCSSWTRGRCLLWRLRRWGRAPSSITSLSRCSGSSTSVNELSSVPPHCCLRSLRKLRRS